MAYNIAMKPQIKRTIWIIGSTVLVFTLMTVMSWFLLPRPIDEPSKDTTRQEKPVVMELETSNKGDVAKKKITLDKKKIFSNIKLVPYDFPQTPATIHAPSDRGQKSDQLTITDHLYRRKIVLKTTGSPSPMEKFPICIDLDTQQWIEEAKLSMISENLYFTDQDGITPLPFHIAHGYGKKATRIWLGIPELPAWTTQKEIYCYYSRSSDYPGFKQIPAFPPQENYYGWYVLDELKDKHIADLSGNINPAELILSSYESSWGGFNFFEEKAYIFFNDYRKWYKSDSNKGVYLTVPGKDLQALSQKGAVEFWFKPYPVAESITQHFMTDTGQHIMIGMLPDRSIFLQLGSRQNRIIWDTFIHQGTWYHLQLSWDFAKKQAKLYLYGKEVPIRSGLSSFSWNSPKVLGDLHFGGYYVESSSYGFSGFMEGFRLHKTPLSPEQAKQNHKYNHFRYYFPAHTMEKEEIAQSNKEDQLSLDFATSNTIPVNEKISINTIYAMPIHYSDAWNGKVYTGKDDLINIIRNPDEYQEVFGMSSHFYSYVGTEVSIQESFLLEYIALKINEPKLIEDIKISFSWLVEYSHPYYPYRFSSLSWTDKALAWLFPPANACGPFYSYKLLGEAKLKLVGIVNGVCWYKPEKPLYVNSLATIMQLEYLPSKQKGALHIKMEDLIFLDSAKQFHRAKLHRSKPELLFEYERIDEESYHHFNSEYIAKQMPMEKGSVELTTNEQNELILVLRNIGTDPIQLNVKSRYYFQENLFTHFLISTEDQQTILEISLLDFYQYLNDTPIPVGHYLHIPLLFEDDSKNYGDLKVKLLRKKGNLDDFDQQTKIISWVLDNKPFEFRSINEEGMIWKEIRKDPQGRLHIGGD
jgi:hypothetical protein